MVRLRVQRHVNGHEVGLLQQLFQWHEFGPAAGLDVKCSTLRVGVQHTHVEPRGAPGHCLADASKSDDAERCAGDVGGDEPLRPPLRPLTGPGVTVHEAHIARDAHENGPGQVGCCVGDDVRRVGNHHAASRCGISIDVVVADGVVRHHFEQRRPVQQFSIDTLVQHADQPVDVGDRL
jgi:hypothetical protein